ncbi:MAG: hypothetical protein V3V05_12060 [Pontiella sp.]
MNPFKFGQVVREESFCRRPQLQKTLTSYICSAQNCVLQGDRRMGKTSLVFQTVADLKGFRILDVDVLGIKSTDDLCKRFARSILALEQKAGLFEKALAGFSSLRPTITFDPLSGQPGISFDSTIKLTPDSIKGLFEIVKRNYNRKKTVVFIDEFQDILNLPDADQTLAMMRAEIQHHQDIPYLYAGSMRNRMLEIFTLPSSPFFKSALPLEIDAIDQATLIPFLTEKFAEGKRILPHELAVQILGLSDHTSGDAQQLCSAIWETTRHGEALEEAHLAPALEHIFAQEIKGYQATLVQLTGQQMNCLKALALMGGKSPASEAFLREAGIQHASSAKRATTRLAQLEIIYPKENDFRFVNPFFKHWLLWKQL